MANEVGSSLLEVLIAMSLLLCMAVGLMNVWGVLIQKRTVWHEKAQTLFLERQQNAYRQGIGSDASEGI